MLGCMLTQPKKIAVERRPKRLCGKANSDYRM
jgi:hypothetical protein